MTGYKIAQINSSDNALIVFTREPEPGKTKTRMMPYLSPEQCVELHRCMLRDISREVKSTDADVIVAYTCSEESAEPSFLRSIAGKGTLFIRQRGESIGSRMQNAIDDVLKLGYKKAVLIGTDIPDIGADTINTAFAMLSACDVVLGPTEDGGYYLIGMKTAYPEAFNVRLYGVSTVFDETADAISSAGLRVEKADMYSDLDTPEDLAGFRRRMRADARLRRSYTGRFLADNAVISIIVPVYNEAAEIVRLLSQLRPYRNECRMIIVDGGSNDGTLKIAEDYLGADTDGFRIIRTNKGRALQMNAGAKEASGDILFFLHCDSTLPDGFVDEIKRVMAAYSWGCFRVGFPSNNFFMLTNRLISNHRAIRRKLPFGDQGIFIDRELFFESGMFPEIPVMEDYEFSLRMRRRKDVKGLGVTRKILMTSARRYGSGTLGIIRTELQMFKLRHMYRLGIGAEKLQNRYDDIR